MMKLLRSFLLLWIISGFISKGYAQSLPVGTQVLEDYYRRQQLLGNGDSAISYTIRPLFKLPISGQKDWYEPDSLDNKNRWTRLKNKSAKYRYGEVIPLPVTWGQQLTSHHPYGWNDGAMIPAKGYQYVLSAGFFVKYGPVSLQVRPELVYASNDDFEGFPTEHYNAAWINYYRFYNNTDLPERFGEQRFKDLLPGQSSARVNVGPISAGLSTENLWWGPGMRSSLLMSNTARGFLHLTLNSTRPVITKIGSFEGQLIAGKLENSGFTPPEPNRTFRAVPLYNPKPDDWRYLSGITLSYHPKWVDGLFIGFARSSQMYSKDRGSGIADYLPVFSPFKQYRPGISDARKREDLSSLFFRWAFRPAAAEIYFEYGKKGHLSNSNGTTSKRAAAYTVGLQKLLFLKGAKQEYMRVALEMTQLQLTEHESILAADSWYTDSVVRSGYTHHGEPLGAGIGPGSDLQTLDISWNKGMKQLGLQLERYVHNNDFYYYTFGDYRIHWVDISAKAHADWNYKNLLINANVGLIRSLNYQWFFRQYDPDRYYSPGRDVLNLQLQLGASYRF